MLVSAPLFLENRFMLFRMSQIGCVVITVFVGMSAQSVQAQYPFGGQSCTNGNGYQGQSLYGQSGYGQSGMFQNPGGNFGSNFYMPGNYGPQNGYVPQQSLGYGGGYVSPGFNLNQSFYPSGLGYNAPAPIQYQPSRLPHHAWHPGHYLFGHY